MIILDFSGSIVAIILGHFYRNPILNEDDIRESVITNILKFKVKFGPKYGKMVIACDGKDYWRKEIFPYYKIKRKKTRDEGMFDWKAIQALINKIREEIKVNLPYPVVEVDRAEGDDVIAVLVQQETSCLHTSRFLIISRDKDLKQLQINPNVEQFNPIDDAPGMEGRWEVCADPKDFLLEHIVKGDIGDSIPNSLSPDNSIAIGQRQKAVTVSRLEQFKMGIPDEHRDRFEQNKKLIDLSCIPNDLYFEIIEEFESQINKVKKPLVNYFLQHGLGRMVASIQDF